MPLLSTILQSSLEDGLTIQAAISEEGLKLSIVKDNSIQEICLDKVQTESLRQMFLTWNQVLIGEMVARFL
jgi:hypothetical protein